MPSVKKNYVFNLLNQLVSFIVPLIVTPYISRIFLADGVGINSFTTANVTYFALFSMLGISGYGQREIAICREDKKKASKLFFELQLIHLFTFAATGALYFVYALNTPSQYRIYYFIHFVTLIACYFDITWFYQAYERFKFIAIRNCAVRLLMLALTFLLIKEKSDLWLYILLTVITTLASNVCLWVGLGKYVERVPLKELSVKKHVKNVLIFFIPTIAASVYSILDKSVINWITCDEKENGYYEQAYKIVGMANIVVQSLANVSAPRMTKLFSENAFVELKKKLNQAIHFMIFISAPVACGIAAIAPRFVPFFFGNGYEKVVELLYVFMPMVVVLGFSVYLDGLFLVPAGKRDKSAIVICIGAALNIGLNIVMVIWWQSVGAAVATLLTELFISIMMIYLSREYFDGKRACFNLAKYVAFSVIMFIVVRFIGTIVENDLLCILLQIFLGALTYVLLLIVTKDRFVKDLFDDVIKKIG